MTITEAERYPNRKASTLELPDFCGPLGDLNRTSICKRAGRLYAMHTFREDVRKEIRRLPKLRNPRRIRGLTGWIQEAELRTWKTLHRMLDDLPECTHPIDQRATLTFENALPDCTCGE